MEQVIFSLTEYVGEIAAVTGVFTIILLFAALHRMRKIKKYIQGIAGNVEDMKARMQAVPMTETAGQAILSEGQGAGNAGQAVESARQAAGLQQTGGNMSPGQLIDEVLGEVFP